MGSRISVPPRTFDQQLESFIAFIKENKITLIGVETKQLESDLKTQREQKQKDNEARRQYGQIHRKLLEDQAVRYARFGTAVQVVRVANRHNEDVSVRCQDSEGASASPAVAATPAAVAATPAAVAATPAACTGSGQGMLVPCRIEWSAWCDIACCGARPA